jgi:hypothetical protein
LPIERFATVRNGTAWIASRCQCGCMRHKKSKKESGNATRASVSKEMAKPRMARSARVAELNLDTSRIPDGANQGHRDLRIENALTDEHGDDVKLKKGARVEVAVTAEPKT